MLVTVEGQRGEGEEKGGWKEERKRGRTKRDN